MQAKTKTNITMIASTAPESLKSLIILIEFFLTDLRKQPATIGRIMAEMKGLLKKIIEKARSII